MKKTKKKLLLPLRDTFQTKNYRNPQKDRARKVRIGEKSQKPRQGKLSRDTIYIGVNLMFVRYNKYKTDYKIVPSAITSIVSVLDKRECAQQCEILRSRLSRSCKAFAFM